MCLPSVSLSDLFISLQCFHPITVYSCTLRFYCVSSQTSAANVTVHIFDMYHSTNMAATLQYKSHSHYDKWHKDPTCFVYACLHYQHNIYFMLLPNVLETNMLTKYVIYAKYFMGLHGKCIHIGHILSQCFQPCETEQCTHISYISLNKYGCHIANIAHTTHMLHGHIDPTFLHMYAKLQQVLNTLLPYMCRKQTCPLKLSIYAI